MPLSAGAVALPGLGPPPRTLLPGRDGLGAAQSLSFFAAPAQEQRAAAEATEHLATFFLDREEYGVDVRQVQEIRRVERDHRACRAPPSSSAGSSTCAAASSRCSTSSGSWGSGEVAVGRAARIVVVRIGDRLLGLLVDGASQVLKVPVSRVEPPPEEVVERAATTSGASPSSTTG